MPAAPYRDWAVKVVVPAAVGAVTLVEVSAPYVTVNDVPCRQAWMMVIVQGPVPLMVGLPGVQVAAVVVTYPGLAAFVVCGAVQPAGTRIVSAELAVKSFAAGALNVKVSVLSVEPAVTERGAHGQGPITAGRGGRGRTDRVAAERVHAGRRVPWSLSRHPSSGVVQAAAL